MINKAQFPYRLGLYTNLEIFFSNTWKPKLKTSLDVCPRVFVCLQK